MIIRNRKNFTDRNLRVNFLLLIGLFVACSFAITTCAAAQNDIAPPVDDNTANQLARKVFQGEEYWWKRTSELKSSSFFGQILSAFYKFIERCFKAIGDYLEWLLEQMGGGPELKIGDWSSGVPFLWIFIGLLAVFIVWQLAKYFRHRPTVSVATASPTPVEELPQAEFLLEQARIALAQSDHKAAIRLAFLSLLAWLQDRGRLKYDPTRSNREYQSDLRRWPDLAASFRVAADPFERCWYGGRNIDAPQVVTVIELCQEYLQSAKGEE